MKFNVYLLLETILMLSISVLWCELGYYYFVFHFNCSNWPGLHSSQQDTSLTKMMLIADTHIMGPFKSVKFDKMRREWQMRQAFTISNSIFQPDVIIFMGDLFDEASFSRDDLFYEACSDFDRIFSFDHQLQELLVIPGNHDIGFHNQMKNFPYPLQRFTERYTATQSIQLSHSPKTEHLNLVLTNSMSFYNDTCLHCSQSLYELKQIERQLRRQHDDDPENFVAPILLGHIPLYRENDLNCSYPIRMAQKVAKANVEGEDVLHHVASSSLLKRLRPRLSISGHTHMLCHTEHTISANHDDDSTESLPELTISSYNHKYAELKPGFLLMTVNSTHVFTKHCSLIEEWVVVSIYVATLMTIVFRLVFMNRAKSDEDEICLQSTTSDTE